MEYKKTAAKGKLILFGEHAVLYRGGALAVPCDDAACEFMVQSSVLETWTLNSKAPERVIQSLKSDWKDLTHNTPLASLTFAFTVNFKGPPGAGLGMSAAWSVALVRFIQAELSWSEEACLSALAFLENRHHGQASGIDHQTIWTERPTLFLGGKTQSLDLDPSFLQNFEVFFTGKPEESTAQMIEIVSKNKDQLLFLNKNIVQKISRGSPAEFRELINQFGEGLEKAGAVNKKISAKFEVFRANGGVVKICGAGGVESGSGVGLAWHADAGVLKQFLSEFPSF